ncbi:hypothetical protein V8F44DRAFT_633902 [Aspergillus fumigatus]
MNSDSRVSFTISRTEFSKRSMFDLHSPSLPRVFPTSGWEVIDPSLPIEEETIPTYRVEKFYPVYIVVGKLGYGSSATVWLYRDLLIPNQEIDIYNHLRNIQIQSNHAGQTCLRPLIEIFQVQNPDGHSLHTCLVHPPLGISLDQLASLLPDKVMSSAMVRTTVRNILAALDFLHTEARIIHSGWYQFI